MRAQILSALQYRHVGEQIVDALGSFGSNFLRNRLIGEQNDSVLGLYANKLLEH